VLLLTSLWIFSSAFAFGQVEAVDSATVSTVGDAVANGERGLTDRAGSSERGLRLMASFTVFLLAVFVGFEVITKVPPTLHTPLMSGSNAISGITVVGALLTAGHIKGGFGSFLGLIALLLAFINVMGGFLVTHRMLMMFKKR
jgi:NAD/NADP transhydrogenase alpha subunit